MDTNQLEQAKTLTEKYFDKFTDWIAEFFPSLLAAVVILIVGISLAGFISNLLSKTLKRAKVSEEVVTFVHSFSKHALRILVLVAALAKLGFNIASLITALGAATVAIGLALQDTLKNVASGLMILVNKPFKVGDYVAISGNEGTVKRIDISSTHLLTLDNKEIILPNSNITVNNITNYSSQDRRRVDLKYSVAYGSDLAKVRNAVKKVTSANDLIMNDPEPFIAVGNLEDSSIEIIVRVWCRTSDYWPVYHYMQENVLRTFGENGIVIPFMQVDVHSAETKLQKAKS